MIGNRLFNALVEFLEGKARRMILIIALLLTAGCAALANTPAQDLAWDRWRSCHAQATGTEIKTVELDGRISFAYSALSDNQTILTCLRQAAKDGPALPEPNSEPRRGGGGGGGGM